MCNDYGNRIPYAKYVEAFSHVRLPLVFPTAAPNLEPRDEIRQTEPALVIRAAPGGVTLVQIPWGLAPRYPRAHAVINLRSEGRSFNGGRCLVPASHYFEFTGTRSPKTRWRFARPEGAWFCFAGLIGHGVNGEGVSLLTVDAGWDAAPIHARQPAIVDCDARGLGGWTAARSRGTCSGRRQRGAWRWRRVQGGGSAGGSQGHNKGG